MLIKYKRYAFIEISKKLKCEWLKFHEIFIYFFRNFNNLVYSFFFLKCYLKWLLIFEVESEVTVTMPMVVKEEPLNDFSVIQAILGLNHSLAAADSSSISSDYLDHRGRPRGLLFFFVCVFFDVIPCSFFVFIMSTTFIDMWKYDCSFFLLRYQRIYLHCRTGKSISTCRIIFDLLDHIFLIMCRWFVWKEVYQFMAQACFIILKFLIIVVLYHINKGAEFTEF